MSERCQKVFDEILRLVPTNRFSEIKKERHGKLIFPIYITEELMTTDLEVLELSPRSSNCLHRAGFKTVGELVLAINGPEDLKKIRNCGVKSVDEIMEQLFCYQYCRLAPERKVRFIKRVLEMN